MKQRSQVQQNHASREGNHRHSGVRQDRERGRGERGDSVRHTEHCIILVEIFVLLDCVGPAILEEKEPGLSCSCATACCRSSFCLARNAARSAAGDVV